MVDERPIGVFDSGVGGLSVLRHIRERLPQESLIYIADSAYMPYGCRSASEVDARCMTLASYFMQRGCKAIVVACNTATAVSVEQLRATCQVPVIGMEPAVKPAAQYSQSKVVGVLATHGTAGSEKFSRLTSRFSQQATFIVTACPGLVECIETGDWQGQEIRTLLHSFLQPMIQQGMDTLVLGCTHYPFILPLISDMVGEGVRLVDSGDAIGRELQRQLQRLHIESGNQAGCIEFWTSGDVARVTPMISRLWGESITVNGLPRIENELSESIERKV